MTNSLIPHTFVPGTKAKAQEVNANFIALADEVQNLQNNTNEKIEQTQLQLNEKIDSTKNNLTENKADIDFVNTNLFTNALLEAPNGVAEFNSQTVTVKQGVKILVPNGKTSDGKMQNAKYVTDSEKTQTVTIFLNLMSVIFLYNTGEVQVIPENLVFYKNTPPTTYQNYVHWYNPDTNLWHRFILNENRWEQIHATPIANAYWKEDYTIAYIVSAKPLNLIKASDLNTFHGLRGILPRELDYVVRRYHSGNEFFYIYKSGWVKQGGQSGGSGDTYINFYVPMQMGYNVTLTRLSGASTSSAAPLWIREESTTTYIKVYSGVNTGKLWSVEGQRLDTEEI